ncbi:MULTISPECIES: ABC transporter ATP-binding protein [Acetobacterium]|jgi:NitT/TauT family transport system ATP-binding protein|uniref:ABC transporter ATP-binding protein n=1 Tax=Acetobacterium wieringae TaxID=52694 RepID=A0A5D0WP73_9FIRM|nr:MULTISPECIES: ABC transporter ATP-binding protein [Acetobacterium]TYC85883.1 ABC transporter ATP-binding protein [Acetobacterium wieringae]
MSIVIKNLSKKYGAETIFENFNLVIKKNKITGILGPSGAGKTTLLNLCSGLEQPDCGTIAGINFQSISYIFQEPRLLPWRTVRENLRFVFKEKSIKMPGPHDADIDAMLELVGLATVGDHYPSELSGGMRQRVSIARAFLYPSELLLMDEPFSSLDCALKNRLIDDFSKIWAQDKRTVIFVSHNEDEISRLAQEVLTFSDKPVQLLSREIRV